MHTDNNSKSLPSGGVAHHRGKHIDDKSTKLAGDKAIRILNYPADGKIVRSKCIDPSKPLQNFNLKYAMAASSTVRTMPNLNFIGFSYWYRVTSVKWADELTRIQ